MSEPVPTPPSDSIKLVLGGTLASGERFAHSQWFDGTGISGDDVAEDTFAGYVETVINATLLDAAFLALYAAVTKWDSATWYFYGADRILHRSLAATLNKPGTASTGTLPMQCATVVTLRTNRAGRSYRGRTYLPCPVSGNLLGNTGQLQIAVCQTLADTYAEFLSTINANVNGAPAVVASFVQNAKTPIIGLDVDTRVDTQRRRAQSATGTTRALADVTT